ncbi:glycosyltransferase family 2 protein [Lacisediminihabitans sp.]|uniref:glycosyltransferase family 2 protein n=1 Tax=Lacisediminihabitans sp. TaxID=2787631 RepID=UPI00374DF202
MQARVTAILVVHSGAAYLERTIAGIARQTRLPDDVIAVDAGSTDDSAELLAEFGPTQLVSVGSKTTFGSAIARAIHVAAPAAFAPAGPGAPPAGATDDEWLWLLAHDNAPEPKALAQLLAAVEIAPSVAIAGPKLMRWEQPDVIAEFGETMTRFGASFALVEGELDQAQHDVQDDVLGVAAGGMLVRRSLWTALGGFDPGLPSIDAALDFSVRARLAGYRVVVVPGARVASAGGPETFVRASVSEMRRARIARTAQLHRRLVYAPAASLVFHWLSLVPLGVLRAIGQVLAKRPGLVGGEFAAAFAVAFGTTGIGRARRNLARSRTLGWAAIASLRIPGRAVRERRAQAREEAVSSTAVVVQGAPRAGFVAHGGLWVVVLAAVVGIVFSGPVLGASSLVGGTLLPLSDTVGQLWSHVGYGWREIGVGFVGASDPFAYVLAVLGSITFWQPSLGILGVYLLALPLAALGAWLLARRLTTRVWLPALAAALYALAPPLLGSLAAGHLGASIVHLVLPWLVLAGLSAPRSWSASAGSALLLAVAAASAPSVAPALLVCWLALLLSRPKSLHRLIWIPLPAAALFLPLVVQQLARGNPMALLADPGVPTGGAETSGLRLALLSPGAGLHGWSSVLHSLSLPGTAPVVLVAVLLAPIGALALLALFVPGARRAAPSMILALLGFATAVIGSHISVATAGGAAVVIWPGAALSLYWLGLIGSVVTGLDSLGRVSVPLGVLAGVASTLLVVPLLGSLYAATATVHPGSRILPAVVTAQANGRPDVGTLVLTPLAGGALAAVVERGSGTTLDDQSTLAATSTRLAADQKRVATLSGNLASRSGFDAASSLGELSIGFVLLARPEDNQQAVHRRTAEALDGNSLFASVGNTANGLLWRYALPDGAVPQRPGNTSTQLGVGILVGQGIVFGLTLLLGIPTVRRRRRQNVSGSVLGEPAGTFDEEDHD